MYNPYSLLGKIILVTGASSGIGQSVAMECSKMGATLIVTGRNEERLQLTYSMLEGEGHRLFVTDLSSYEGVRQLVDFCPMLDGVSHNAGIATIVPVKFITEASLEALFTTNTVAPILLTQLLVRMKKMKRPASIVFTSSLSGVFCVHYGESMYAASKGALSGFAKGAALDLASQQIRVNCVNPSIIRTNIFESAGVISEEHLEEKVKNYPLKRLGVPTDVAFAIIYLLSDASSWVTGVGLPIDGGYTLI
jgi:NAD(P)-dependent dehydrogenase (short-subunit alcohol dehydrogenase family)